MSEKRKTILAKIKELQDRLTDDQCVIASLHDDCQQLSEERDAAIKRAQKFEEESIRLRAELGYIANARMKNFEDDYEFRQWAQGRARHAIGQEAGTLTIKKGSQ